MSLKSLFFLSSLFGEGTLNENVSVERKSSALEHTHIDGESIFTLTGQNVNNPFDSTESREFLQSTKEAKNTARSLQEVDSSIRETLVNLFSNSTPNQLEGFNFGGLSLNFNGALTPNSVQIEVDIPQETGDFQIDAVATYDGLLSIELAGSVTAGNVAGGRYNCTISAQLEGAVASVHVMRTELDGGARTRDSVSLVVFNEGIFRSPLATCTGNSDHQLVSEALETLLDGESIESSSLSSLVERIGTSLEKGLVLEAVSNLFSNLPNTRRFDDYSFSGDTGCCGHLSGLLTFTGVTSRGSTTVEITRTTNTDTSLARYTVIDSLVSYDEPLQIELAGTVTDEFGDVHCTVSVRLENAFGSAHVVRRQFNSGGSANNQLSLFLFNEGTFRSPSVMCTTDDVDVEIYLSLYEVNAQFLLDGNTIQ